MAAEQVQGGSFLLIGRYEMTMAFVEHEGRTKRITSSFSQGVLKGRISINKFVGIISTANARLFGLFPRKRTIAVGSDADIVREAVRQTRSIAVETTNDWRRTLMSAFKAYRNEKQKIDALLNNGFVIAGTREDQDGTAVRFKRIGSTTEIADLQLLTADARKYVSGLIFARLKETGS
ncbi:hypothetical protein [uncultured Paenibacillus sp.]|uniref:hypothetical protein n=1 Tax=Paenibacillus sp. TaxID=58172 RepID=UPI0037DC37DC